ncbi:MAG: conjugal transfer protein TraG N-terminal domain-containing protein [Thermofilaceae archaeon]
MEWVVTAGADVQNILFILNAIAAIFNSDSLKVLASILVMLSLFFALVTYQTRPGGGLYLIGRWFVLFLFFYSMFHIKTTVTVRSASGISAPVQVANVPLPVAFFGSVFTNLDYAISRLFDDAFGVPVLTGSSRGVGFSAIDLYFRQGQDALLTLVSSNNRHHIDNMNAFFDNCIVKTVMQGYISMETLQRHGWLGVAILVNPAFYTPVKKADGSVEYKSCQDAINDFATAYNQLASLGNSSPLYRILFPGADVTALNNMFVSGSTAAVAWLSGGTLSSGLNQVLADAAAFNFFMQSLSRNSINPASFAEGYVKVAGESCMQGVMSQRYLPLMKTIMFYLVFGVLPLVLLFLLTPMWKTTLLSVGTIGLWFAFWSALTSIFNGLVGLFVRDAFSGYNGVVGSNSVLASVYFINNFTDMACMTAGYASYIPVIALALASGSMYALTNVAGSLAGTVKAAGDRVTDAYDFAGRETAMALDAARGVSQYNAVSTSLAQADAVNAFAGSMHNMAYSNPFVKSTMVAAENQAYGIGAVMRHMAAAKTDRLDYYDTVSKRLRPFELNSPFANSSDGFVNALRAYFRKLGRNLDIYKTTDGYLLYENGVFLGSVENGRINWASTPVQVAGAVNLSNEVNRNASRSREGGHNVSRETNVASINQDTWYRGNRTETGQGVQRDIVSSVGGGVVQEVHAGSGVTMGFGSPTQRGSGGPRNQGGNNSQNQGGNNSQNQGSNNSQNQGSNNSQNQRGGVVGEVVGTILSHIPLPKIGLQLTGGESTTATEESRYSNEVRVTPRFTRRTSYRGYENKSISSVTRSRSESDSYSDKRSLSDSYSSKASQSDTVSYSLNVPASDLVKHFSKLMGLNPTTANESALLLMAGSLLMASDKNFADKVNESIAKERLGIQEMPSDVVSKEIPKVEQELEGIKKDLVPEGKKEGKEEEKKKEPKNRKPSRRRPPKPPEVSQNVNQGQGNKRGNGDQGQNNKGGSKKPPDNISGGLDRLSTFYIP